MLNEKIIEKAKRKFKKIQKLRNDPRYLKTMGKLKRAGFLDVRDMAEYRGQVFLEDALWAAELEPRIYELLPAIIARRPKFFAFLDLPEDLELVVKEIKRGLPNTPYRGVAPEKYAAWSLFVGQKSTAPKVMGAFRLAQEDMDLLRRLSEKMSKSQSKIISQALREFEKRS
jgi:hypothetical protein